MDAAARQAIRERLETYFFSLDARDAALTASCFSADAEIVHRGGGQHFTGGAALAESLPTMLSSYRSTIHALANLHLDDRGAGAHARYSAIITLESEGDGGIIVRGVRYDDDLERSGDQWVIVRRFHEPLWQFSAAAGGLAWPGPS
jgi:hypothetical protein